MKKVIILGKPNVGKSSLFNRLAKKRIAITSDIAGTTRDINKKVIALQEHFIELLDTGGIDESTEFFTTIKRVAFQTAKQVDLILYIVDGKLLPDDEDKKLFYTLQKFQIPCFLIVNKIDNDKEMQQAYHFNCFGAKNTFFISISHNRGVTSLIQSIAYALNLTIYHHTDESLEEFLNQQISDHLITQQIQEEVSPQISIGIIGRVNVGKSSLLNALLGKERSIVSEIEGTTIDPVDDELTFQNYRLYFVDTAGLRRKSKIKGIEKFALERTEKILEKSDIALLVLDASTPFVELDEKISSLVDKYALGVIIILNKWDIRIDEYKNILKSLRYKFRFLEYAPIITASAINKRHITEIKKKIIEIYENFSFRIPTNQLNKTIIEATKKHPIPSDHGKLVRIYYAAQFDTKPPKIALVMNRPKSLHFSYKRYLVNYLRTCFNLKGTPIHVIPRDKKDSFEENKA